MAVTIYGASDDLIEIDGDIYEEFGWYASDDDASTLVAVSDGTLLRIRRDHNGVWRIAPVSNGKATLTVEQAPEDDDQNRTDRATLDGYDITWVAHASTYALKR